MYFRQPFRQHFISKSTLHSIAGSRSGSPSSRYSYKTYDPSGTPVRHVESSTLGRPRRLSSSGMVANAIPPRAPRSSNTSREPSPNRGGNHSVLSKPARLLLVHKNSILLKCLMFNPLNFSGLGSARNRGVVKKVHLVGRY